MRAEISKSNVFPDKERLSCVCERVCACLAFSSKPHKLSTTNFDQATSFILESGYQIPALMAFSWLPSLYVTWRKGGMQLLG